MKQNFPILFLERKSIELSKTGYNLSRAPVKEKSSNVEKLLLFTQVIFPV